MAVKTTVDEKKKLILSFFKKKKNLGFSQGEIIKNLESKLEYVSDSSARVSLSNIMSELEKDGLVYFEEHKPKRGRLLMKKWFLKENGA